MWSEFESAYLTPQQDGVELRSAEVTTTDEGAKIVAQLLVKGQARTVSGSGGGPISAFMQALSADEVIGAAVEDLDVVDYAEHAVAVGGISAGSDATAVAFVETKSADGTVHWGVGLHESILTASLRAVVSALNQFTEPAH
jgi:2-isopropylmalate synthase